MLSKRLQLICLCSAYMYELYAYVQHTHTICNRMLRIRVSSEINFDVFFRIRMMSIRIKFVSVC